MEVVERQVRPSDTLCPAEYRHGYESLSHRTGKPRRASVIFFRVAMRTVPEIAVELAKAHKEDDPQTTDVYFVEGVDDEVRLVEVSGSLSNGGPGEVLPFRFTAQPADGVPFPSVVVLLSPSEWDAVAHDKLKLPAGWDKARLKKVG
jgi:hypothetical protein